MSSVQPMVLGTEVPRGGLSNWKLPVFLSLFAGAGCFLFWTSGYGERLAGAEAPITMASPGVRPVRALQPAQLSKYGIGSTPLERAALIAIQAKGNTCGRSVSMKAESDMRKEVESMDSATKKSIGKA